MKIIDVIVFILTLLGSLGLFLYGIKMLSDSLQKVAGNKMRSILYKMTSNRFKGVLTGFLITAVIQSSSASTVMVISFVNAGLLSLTGAISVIMGANIGTTVTAWLISILGFKISISAISLPIIGVSLALMFSKNEKRKAIGEMMIGFGILFIGLQFLTDSIPDMHTHPEGFQFLNNFTGFGFGSILIFVLFGAIITMIIQSSSASMALTLVLCFNGILPFSCAAAMVLGQNIGTTITANIAAMIGNKSAKRAAMAHLVFNVIGVILALIVFNPSLKLIDEFMIKSSGTSPLYGDLSDESVRETIPIALSIYHTAFNIINTMILIWFTDSLAKLVIFLIPDKESDEDFRLKFISQGWVGTSELATIQAKKEIVFMAQQTNKMILDLGKMSIITNDKEFSTYYNRIDKYEEISDRMLLEITKYLINIPQHGEISKAASSRILAMLKIIDEIERIADRCFQFAKTVAFKNEKKVVFPPDLTNGLLTMISAVEKSYQNMIGNLNNDYHLIDLTIGNSLENEINAIRDELQNKNAEMLQDNFIDFTTSNIYGELNSTCERIGDIIQNVNHAIATCKD
ncbi:MAG: Na/Pi cotransporter family protein [Bacteroidales bacterium]|nr:Na/Pi cotransporter family protein [Bacteroidales bacterium]